MLRLSGLHHGFMLTKRIWAHWMFLFLMVSSTCSLVTVHQPPVVSSALGGAVVLQCQLILSPDEKLRNSPVLYWDNMNTSDRLWPLPNKYSHRVQLMDSNTNSFNKSLLLKDVQWDDSRKYLCKLSINTMKEACRKLGGGSSLMVYDTMIFNTPNDTNPDLLRCKVQVTRDPALVLSISHNGSKLQSVSPAPHDAAAAPPIITLSISVSVRGGGAFECHLDLNTVLITKSSFFHNPTVAEEERDAVKTVPGTYPPTVTDPGALVFPEPWFLYGSLVLVPITILLGIITFWKGRC